MECVTKFSGEICELSGIYWATGCGHADCIDIDEGATFPTCEICQHRIGWIHSLLPAHKEFLPNSVRKYIPPNFPR